MNINIKKIGFVKRVRDYTIYLENGKRLQDLYLDCQLVMGHKSKGSIKKIKNSMSKGIFMPLKSIYQDRIFNSLSLLYKNLSFRVFSSEKSVLEAINSAFNLNLEENFLYSKYDFENEEIKVIKKRVLDNFFEVPDKSILLPNLLIPSDFRVFAIFFPREFENRFKESDIISPIKLFSLASGIGYINQIENLKNKKIKERKENVHYFDSEYYANFDTGAWNRRSCYIEIEKNEKDYEKLFEEGLTQGILINPNYDGLSVLPAFISKKKKKIIENFLQFNL